MQSSETATQKKKDKGNSRKEYHFQKEKKNFKNRHQLNWNEQELSEITEEDDNQLAIYSLDK